jgi:hypothetical protein
MSIVIENIDWALLREQKEFCLNHGCDDAMGLAHFLDYVQDKAVEQGYSQSEVFGDLLDDGE